MEELKRELEKLSKTYVDTPEKEEKILIPFIKRLLELSVKERRKLLPTIRELQWIKGKFSETFCDHHRARFLGAVQFVCGNKREMDLGYHIDFNLLCKLLSLYTPSWLAEYINDAESYLNFNISYEQLMQLIDMGYMQELSPKRIAQILPGYICIRSSLPKGKDTFEYGVRGNMILYMSFRSFIPLLRLKVNHRLLIEKLFPFGSCQSVG